MSGFSLGNSMGWSFTAFPHTNRTYEVVSPVMV